MRKPRFPPLLSCMLGFFLASAGHAAVAQCGSSYYTAKISCSNPTCNQTVYQYMPDFGEYGIIYYGSVVTCCGRTYPSFIGSQIPCNGSGQLADPSVRQHLIELAKYQGVMVTVGGGEFHPLEVALSEEPASGACGHPILSEKRRTLPGIGSGGR